MPNDSELHNSLCWHMHTLVPWEFWKTNSNVYTSIWASLIAQLGKESTHNAGHPSSIPGSRRSTGEGIGYPLQFSWASVVAQLVKNPPAMRETWDQSLGWEDPLEKGKATHSSILAYRIPWTTVRGVANSRTQLSDFHIHFTDK